MPFHFSPAGELSTLNFQLSPLGRTFHNLARKFTFFFGCMQIFLYFCAKIMKIGVFDSGYGGLTILTKIREVLPQYDYLYVGDNARAPYGTRSFSCIYQYTRQAVRYLQNHDCRLVILACNTASAKALRTIQQNDINPDTLRVLGVIRPTVEVVPSLTQTGHIGILATPATVASGSYPMELEKVFAAYHTQPRITQQPCPMWVPLIESGEQNTPGAQFFVHKYLTELLAQDPQIDTILLGCTHYPLLYPQIEKELAGSDIRIVEQGTIVAASLQDYLHRHHQLETCLSRGGSCVYLTTEDTATFDTAARRFTNTHISAQHLTW